MLKIIQNWQPTQDEIDLVIKWHKELIESTVLETGDTELVQDYREELKALKYSTFNKKQELARVYISYLNRTLPFNSLWNDEILSPIIRKLFEKENDAAPTASYKN